MGRWRPKCPRCGSTLDISKIKYGIPFPCPSCMTSLYISGFYFALPNLVAIIVSYLFGYSFGLRSWQLGLFLALLQFPLMVFFLIILTKNFNPKIEEHYNDFDLKRHF